MVADASPPPSPAPPPHATPGSPHPTYTKMITHALTELGGYSERPGIADYIHDRFSGLPSSHDALLSAHLRRLVAEGVLRTDGADSLSYSFAPPPPPAGEKRGPGRPRKDTGASTPVATPLGEKRGPGRPRKIPSANPQENPHTPLLPAKRKRSREDETFQPGSSGGEDSSTEDEATEHLQADQARTFQNGGDATPVQSGGAPTTAIKRRPGRPWKVKPAAVGDATPVRSGGASTTVIKRRPGRPWKVKPAAAGDATPVQSGGASTTAIKRRPGRPWKVKPAAAGDATPVQSGGASTTAIKRRPGRPWKVKPAATAAAAAMSSEPGTHLPSTTTGSKRRPGRPRKEKPPGAATSPTAGAAALRGFKRGCGRPTMDRASAAVSPESRMEKLAAAAAAMYAETGDAASTGDQAGGGQSRMEKLAAAVAAMSAEGTKRGPGRPRKERTWEAVAAAISPEPTTPPSSSKRGRGRPRKEKPPSVAVYEAFFRDMMAEANTRRRRREEEEEDSVSGKKTRTEKDVPNGEGKETGAAVAGHVPVSGENAMSAPAGATDPDLGPANLADAATSTGIKRPRGRPRKYPAPAAADDGVSTGVKRGRGRPWKKKPVEATSAPETGDAVSTGAKRGRGRPRIKPLAAAGVKRSRGRPRKDHSIGTGFAEAASKVLFGDMAEAPGDLVSGEKTQTEGAAPGDRKETRVAGDGGVPVSGQDAASAHVGDRL